MEVLKTGEELERQILEDARKKASRTLEAAEKDCQAIRAELDAELGREVARLEQDRDRRIAALRAELEAQLPLDFMRARLAWVDTAVKKVLRDLFAAMPDREVAEILASRIREAAGQFAGRQVMVSHAGLPDEAVRALVEQAMPGVPIAGLRRREAVPAEEPSTGLLIESTDGKLRLRCTLEELESELLEEHREELAEALLGREAAGGGAIGRTNNG